MGIWYKLKKESENDNISTSILADYLLEYEGDISQLTIKKLCANAKVSYATPTRLAQKLGYVGFGEFKYTLINETNNINNNAFKSHTLDIEDYRKKLNESLDRSLISITDSDIEYIANAFIKYERIKIYGIGQSGQIANELQARLIRFNKLPISPLSESEIFTSSRLANKNDLVVAISYSGHTETIMEPLKHCYNNGVETILFTANPTIENVASKIVRLDLLESDVSNYSMLSKIVLAIILDFIYLKMIELQGEYRQYLDLTSMHK